MFKIREYWEKVRKHEAELPDGDVWVMSIGDPLRGLVGGVVVEVPRETAARSIVDKTHRLATKTEIDAHLAALQEHLAQLRQDAMRKAGVTVVQLDAVAPRGRTNRG